MDPILHVTLVRPEIPNNTGAIGRTCVATGCGLHLVRPIAFDTSEKACRRAGLDYWARLSPREHDGWDEYVRATGAERGRMWLFTTKSARPQWGARFGRGDHLVFGSETSGLPGELLEEFGDRLVTLPMLPGERSLNLANAACAAVYEAIRQLHERGEITLDARGRLGKPGDAGA